MNPILSYLIKPFIEKKLHEYQSTNTFKDPKPHPAQTSTQIAKVGIGASVATFTQVETVEGIVGSIVFLLINLFFLYYPGKRP